MRKAISGHPTIPSGAHLHDLAAVVDVAREPPEARAQEPGARYDAHRQTEPGRVEIAPRWVLGTALVDEFLEVGATSEYLMREEINGHQRQSMVIRGWRHE